MGKIHKFSTPRNLAQYKVLVQDTDPLSKAFVLAQIPDTLTIGKNAFLINGSQFLEPSTPVLVEITDVHGNTIFSQPIKNYQEGLARVISIEIYSDTPLGTGLITIMGELQVNFDGSPIPSAWVNKYNVKWQQPISINPAKANVTPIRLYNFPTIDVAEIFNPSRAVSGSVLTVNGTGSVVGTSRYFYTGSLNQSYTLAFAENNLVKEMVSGTFMATINGVPYTSSIDSIINYSTLYVTTPFSSNGVPINFSITGYKIVYPSAPVFTYSPLNESFVQITLSDLTTFAGELRRVKLFSKGTDTDVDYKQISDTLISPAQLLTNDFNGELAFNYGYFTNQNVINTFWSASFSP